MKKLVVFIVSAVLFSANAFAADASAIVGKAYDHMRGQTSLSEVDMTIHRPDFERTMGIKAWTRGRSDAVFCITSPVKDAGNGTLKLGHRMWTYNPNINRVIKLPPSMMSQSWMGSDFSNNDLSKTDSILNDYHHKIITENTAAGHTVYTIQSIPKDGAAVVWGKVQMRIRDDGILLSQEFFDQDMVPVKELSTQNIKMMGGRLFPALWIMKNLDEKGKYTSLTYKSLKFNVKLSDRIFTTTFMKSMGD